MLRQIAKVLAGLALAACSALTLAQPAYPGKPVRLIVGFPPGGGNDIMARLVAAKLQEAWVSPVVVENKPGAAGMIANEFVAKAPADGYTLLVGAPGQLILNMIVYPKAPFDAIRDFAPIAVMGFFPVALAVHPAVPAHSVQELIGLARSKPGQLNYGAGATVFQVAMEMFKQATGVDVRHIPYKGSAMTVNATVAGDVQMLFVDSAPVLPSLKAGRLRGLAVTSAQRTALLPDLPTLAEAGVPGFNMTVWSGLLAPAGAPADVISKVNREVTRAVRLPEMREKLAHLGIDAGGSTPEEFAELLRSELARYTAVVKAANIKAE